PPEALHLRAHALRVAGEVGSLRQRLAEAGQGGVGRQPPARGGWEAAAVLAPVPEPLPDTLEVHRILEQLDAVNGTIVALDEAMAAASLSVCSLASDAPSSATGRCEPLGHAVPPTAAPTPCTVPGRRVAELATAGAEWQQARGEVAPVAEAAAGSPAPAPGSPGGDAPLAGQALVAARGEAALAAEAAAGPCAPPPGSPDRGAPADLALVAASPTPNTVPALLSRIPEEPWEVALSRGVSVGRLNWAEDTAGIASFLCSGRSPRFESPGKADVGVLPDAGSECEAIVLISQEGGLGLADEQPLVAVEQPAGVEQPLPVAERPPPPLLGHAKSFSDALARLEAPLTPADMLLPAPPPSAAVPLPAPPLPNADREAPSTQVPALAAAACAGLIDRGQDVSPPPQGAPWPGRARQHLPLGAPEPEAACDPLRSPQGGQHEPARASSRASPSKRAEPEPEAIADVAGRASAPREGPGPTKRRRALAGCGLLPGTRAPPDSDAIETCTQSCADGGAPPAAAAAAALGPDVAAVPAATGGGRSGATTSGRPARCGVEAFRASGVIVVADEDADEAGGEDLPGGAIVALDPAEGADGTENAVRLVSAPSALPMSLTDQPPVVVLFTGFSRDDLSRFRRCVSRLRGVVLRDLPPDARHEARQPRVEARAVRVVARCEGDPSARGSDAAAAADWCLEAGGAAPPWRRAACRTIKYCEAILAGSWVLSPGWVLESSEAGRWLPEADFEIAGDSAGSGGPARGRLCGPQLLAGLRLHFAGAGRPPALPRRREPPGSRAAAAGAAAEGPQPHDLQ
ncbi:unnamed protein product, partial [Prorocentrum cordatum]